MAFTVQKVIFLSLLLDLFAFTIPLPLFPRLVEWYINNEEGTNGPTSQILGRISEVRARFTGEIGVNTRKSWDVVLLGGLMGSLFSALQFIISPYIGSLSDRYGRKNVLLFTMIGNVLSGLVWAKSTTFASYLMSRALGGISEGNVQLSIAIISDVTTAEDRSKDLALIGIAFAIAFCIGPPIGAWFSTHPLPLSTGIDLNLYATPAIVTLVLLCAEIILLIVALPETRPQSNSVKTASSSSKPTSQPSSDGTPQAEPQERLALLKRLGRIHFFFLAVFSGVEFTLTFLTFDLFNWTNAQNGKLLMTIGIISALLQGGYTRRVGPLRQGALARRGVITCAVATIILSLLPGVMSSAKDGQRNASILTYVAAICLAFTSATVVNSLNALASLQCDDEGSSSELAKGKALGKHRSLGQLGRAIGPILACVGYWVVGPQKIYTLASVALTSLLLSMDELSPSTKTEAA